MFSTNLFLFTVSAAFIAEILTAPPVGVKFRCVENSFWTENCQKCACQFGKATCKPIENCWPSKVKISPALKAIAERVRELLNNQEFLNSIPTIPPDTPYELTCIPGEVFRISCDFCQCRNNGIPYCQNKYCPEKQNNTQQGTSSPVQPGQN